MPHLIQDNIDALKRFRNRNFDAFAENEISGISAAFFFLRHYIARGVPHDQALLERIARLQPFSWLACKHVSKFRP